MRDSRYDRLGSWLCQPHLADDPAPGEGARSDGGDVRLPDAPGLGVAPDEEWLGEPWTVFD